LRFFLSIILTGFVLAGGFSAPLRAETIMEDYPSVKLQGLDKSVGRTMTFEATVGSTIQYGPLFIKIHACRKAPPIEKPESAAFLQIWEVPPGEKKSEWVFSGWMFASSPALSAMDHPVYDVWVLDCIGKEEPVVDSAPEEEEAVDQEDSAQSTPEADIPTDSEAEPEEPQKTPVDSEAATQDSTPPPNNTYPAFDPDIPVQTPVKPAEERGVTAYDFMEKPKPPNGATPPATQPAPDPDAAYGY
jgi:hypothetical protein